MELDADGELRSGETSVLLICKSLVKKEHDVLLSTGTLKCVKVVCLAFPFLVPLPLPEASNLLSICLFILYVSPMHCPVPVGVA